MGCATPRLRRLSTPSMATIARRGPSPDTPPWTRSGATTTTGPITPARSPTRSMPFSVRGRLTWQRWDGAGWLIALWSVSFVLVYGAGFAVVCITNIGPLLAKPETYGLAFMNAVLLVFMTNIFSEAGALQRSMAEGGDAVPGLPVLLRRLLQQRQWRLRGEG